MGAVIGIDLAGSHRRPTGWACIMGSSIRFKTLFLDRDVLAETLSSSPELICIDAPLTLPRRGMMRYVDRRMRSLGFPVLPPGFPGMFKLTVRGIRMRGEFEANGCRVIEVHPTSTLKALGLGSRDDFIEFIANEGYEVGGTPSEHELDAIIAAITGEYLLRGEAIIVGDDEGSIVLPIPGRLYGVLHHRTS